MWLVIRQLPITAEWWDAHAPGFSRTNKQKLSANVAIGLHSHPHLHKSMLPILFCGAKLISSSDLFYFSDTKCFWGITLRGSISNGFSVLICLVTSSSISKELLLVWEKGVEQFFSISLLINFASFFLKNLK